MHKAVFKLAVFNTALDTALSCEHSGMKRPGLVLAIVSVIASGQEPHQSLGPPALKQMGRLVGCQVCWLMLMHRCAPEILYVIPKTELVLLA